MRKIYLEKFGRDSVVIAYGAYVKKSRMTPLIRKWLLNIEDYFHSTHYSHQTPH
jgi:hypothetical protein